MSVKEKIAARKKAQGAFICVAGQRLSGKSTIAGTAPGRTLMLQAAILETGSRSAAKLAKQRGNELTISEFSDLTDLVKKLTAFDASQYDNLFIDGISAITELKIGEPDVAATMKRDQWAGYRIVGEAVRNFMKNSKAMAGGDLNVFITLALQPKTDANGAVTELVPALKGNVALAEISRLCPVFVTLLPPVRDEEGKTVREMVTASQGVYPGRIDHLLDDENPQIIESDLSVLLDLINS